MRLGKQRGSTSKDAMPIGPHRTSTQGVNVSELERVFDAGADVTLESLREKGLIKHTRTDVKILGNGELSKKLAVTAHAFSASAREKIESAGGSATALRQATKRKRSTKAKETGAVAAAETEAGAKGEARQPDEAVDAEPTDREAIADAAEAAEEPETAEGGE
jgi:ribosomal protein L18E